MTTEDVTKNIWRNTVSNYFCIGLRLVLGLLMFRMLYQAMSKEEFGYWALLWSLFGYGILLDFGFGFAAVKRVAELSATENWEELSRVLSTIFFLYVGIGILICALIILGSNFLVGLFQITPANHERFREILIYFVLGMGITFPFGIFPEILIGLQRICLTNVIFSAGMVANFVVLLVAVKLQWGIKSYVVIGLLSGLLPCLISAIYALRCLPKVKIRLRNFSWGMVSSTVKFSIFVYVSIVSGMILTRTDQLLLSTALAVSAVAIYQAAAKVSEMFSALAQQLPDTFSPAAAHLNASGDKAFLQKLLINGTRFSVMIATPFYFICAFYMEGLLRIVTGDSVPSRETFWVGQVLVLWGYMSLITQSVPKRIFMMCGHERRLMWLSLGEAVLNLALSLGLLLYFKNVVCVAIGSLVATTVFGWFYLWPWAAREASLSGLALARQVLVPIWLACLPLLAFVAIGRFTPWLDFRTSTVLFLTQCVVAAGIGAMGLWRHALTTDEREMFLQKVAKMFARTSFV